MWVLFCMTLPLNANALLGTDHLLQLLQRYGTVYWTILRKNDFDKFKRLIEMHYFKGAYSDLSYRRLPPQFHPLRFLGIIVSCQVCIRPYGSGFKVTIQAGQGRVLQMFVEGRACQHLIWDDAFFKWSASFLFSIHSSCIDVTTAIAKVLMASNLLAALSSVFNTIRTLL